MVMRPHPAAPFTAPTSGDINQRLAQIAEAINTKASAATTPVYHSLALIDDSGQVWRIQVATDGTLSTDPVTVP